MDLHRIEILLLNETELKANLPMILALLSFITYWFLAHSTKIKQKYYSKYAFDLAASKHIFFTKVLGFVTMGIIPLMVCLFFIKNTKLTYFGLGLKYETLAFTLKAIGILSIIIIPIVYYSAKQEKNLLNYPQVRAKTWTNKTIFYNAFGWTIYLLGYELLFRGILFFPLVETLGLSTAITINVILYSATHIPKGVEETIGAIPLSIVLCLLTYVSENIWIAFIVHVVMALTNEFTAFLHHPDFQYKNER